MTDAGWKRILRIMDEAFEDYLSGMAALEKRVVVDLKRKLSDSKVLGGPLLEPSSPPERLASAARPRRARGRRPRSMVVFMALCATVAIARNAHAQNKCQGAKINAAGKKAACIAGLEAKRVSKGTPIDSGKLAKCQDKVSAAYAKLETKGNCNTTGDAGAIENKVDAFVADLVSALDVANTTTSTTLPMNCPGAPCASFGEGCTANGDCCSNNCELSGMPPFCGVAVVPGGCCQLT